MNFVVFIVYKHVQYEGSAKEGGKGTSIWDTFTHKYPGYLYLFTFRKLLNYLLKAILFYMKLIKLHTHKKKKKLSYINNKYICILFKRIGQKDDIFLVKFSFFSLLSNSFIKYKPFRQT